MMRNAEKKAARQKPLKEGLQRPFASLDRWLTKNKYMLGDSRWSIADLNVCSVIQYIQVVWIDTISKFSKMVERIK